MGMVEHNVQLSANLAAAQERALQLHTEADQLPLSSDAPMW